MKVKKTEYFKYGFREASLFDIGKHRKTNEDQVIECPEYGFFGVSDGMGGLSDGGKTSQMIATVLPGLVRQASAELREVPSAPNAADILEDAVRMISNSIYETGNRGGSISFGATLCCVWLIDEYAVFINLGDSRGYLLPYYKHRLRRITRDHNVAALLVEQGELTPEAARNHPSSTRLTKFVGMPSPAGPETFIEAIGPGDRILLCSDGLHGMVEDQGICRIIRSSRSPRMVCGRLIDEANANGGADNISAICVKIVQ